MVGAGEVDLRRALRAASVDLRGTDEFKSLLSAGPDLMSRFLAEAVTKGAPEDRGFVVRFVVPPTTSFAERTTDEGTDGSELVRQADLLTDMLFAALGISATDRGARQAFMPPLDRLRGSWRG